MVFIKAIRESKERKKQGVKAVAHVYMCNRRGICRLQGANGRARGNMRIMQASKKETASPSRDRIGRCPMRLRAACYTVDGASRTLLIQANRIADGRIAGPWEEMRDRMWLFLFSSDPRPRRSVGRSLPWAWCRNHVDDVGSITESFPQSCPVGDGVWSRLRSRGHPMGIRGFVTITRQCHVDIQTSRSVSTLINGGLAASMSLAGEAIRRNMGGAAPDIL